MKVIGLHWLLAKTTGLMLTSPEEGVRRATADYLAALAECCSDLGGDMLVFGSPAQRRIPSGATKEQATVWAVDTFRRAAPAFSANGVTLCVEPLSPPEADFLNTADEAEDLMRRLDHPSFKLHLDVKAMSTEDAPPAELVRRHAASLRHFHANDPNKRGPGFGDTDFVPIFKALKDMDTRLGERGGVRLFAGRGDHRVEEHRAHEEVLGVGFSAPPHSTQSLAVGYAAEIPSPKRLQEGCRLLELRGFASCGSVGDAGCSSLDQLLQVALDRLAHRS